MWLLHLLPESFILFLTYCLIGIGTAGLLISWFITFVPFLNIYRKWIQIASILLLVSGIYWYGGYSVEMMWRNEVAKLEEKVREAEAKSAVVNTEIEIVYRDRVKVVKQDVVVIQEKIREVEKVIDKGCVIAPEAISTLNEAAKPKKGTVEVGPLKKDEKQ
jgi:hypothetical protein